MDVASLQVKVTNKGLSATITELNVLSESGKRAEEATASLSRGFERVSAAASSTIDNLDRVESVLEQVEDSSGGASRSMSLLDAGKSAFKGISAFAGKAGSAISKMASGTVSGAKKISTSLLGLGKKGFKGFIASAGKGGSAILKMARATVSGAAKITVSLAGLGKKAFKGFSALAGQAGAAVFKMAKETVASAKEITRLSEAAGMSNINMQKMAAGAKSVGVSTESLSGQYKSFNDNLSAFTEKGGGQMKDFFTKIAPKIGLTSDAFKGLSGADGLQLYYDSLKKANLSQKELKSSMETVAVGSSKLIPLLEKGGAGFKKFGDDAQKSGAVMSDDLIKNSLTLGTSMDKISQSMEGAKNKLMEALMPSLIKLADWLMANEETVGMFTDGLAMVAKIAGGVLVIALTGLHKLMTFVGESVAAVVLFFDNFEENISGLPEPVQAAIAAVQNLFSTGWEVVKSIFETVFEAIGALLSGDLDSFLDIISGALDSILETVSNIFGFIIQVVKDTWNSIVETITELFDQVVDTIMEIGGNMVDYIKDMWNSIVDKTKELFNKVVDTVMEIGGNIVDYIKDMWNSIVDKTSELLGKVIEKVKSIWTSIIDKTSELLGQVVKKVDSIWTSIVDMMKDFLNSIVDAVKDGWTKAVAKTKELLDNIVKTVTEIGGKMLDAGKEIVNGLIKGIKDKAKAAYKAAEDLASGVWKSVKEFMHINSPSKKMAKLGRGTAIGLAMGISSGAGAVDASTNKMTKSVIDKATAMQKKIALFGKNTDSEKLAVGIKMGDFKGADPKAIESLVNYTKAYESLVDAKKSAAELEQQKTSASAAFEGLSNSIRDENPLQKMQADHDARLAIITKAAELEVIAVEDAEKAKAKIEKDFHYARSDLIMSQYEGVFGNLAQMTGDFMGKQSKAYKVMFGIEKGFAIARSIMAIQQGIAQAISLPFPASLAAIAQVVSATGNVVSTIKSIREPQGQAHDGMGKIPSTGTYMLKEGERVVNEPDNKKMTRFLDEHGKSGSPRGGGINVNVHNYSGVPVTVEQKDNGDIDVTIQQEVKKAVEKQVPSALANFNSPIGKALKQNWNVSPKR